MLKEVSKIYKHLFFLVVIIAFFFIAISIAINHSKLQITGMAINDDSDECSSADVCLQVSNEAIETTSNKLLGQKFIIYNSKNYGINDQLFKDLIKEIKPGTALFALPSLYYFERSNDKNVWGNTPGVHIENGRAYFKREQNQTKVRLTIQQRFNPSFFEPGNRYNLSFDYETKNLEDSVASEMSGADIKLTYFDHPAYIWTDNITSLGSVKLPNGTTSGTASLEFVYNPAANRKPAFVFLDIGMGIRGELWIDNVRLSPVDNINQNFITDGGFDATKTTAGDYVTRFTTAEFDERILFYKELGIEPIVSLTFDQFNPNVQNPRDSAALENAVLSNPEFERIVKMNLDIIRYANVEKNYGIKYWEFGNEPEIWWTWINDPYDSYNYGFITEKIYQRDKLYGKMYARFAGRAKEIDPSIKIGVAVTFLEDSYKPAINGFFDGINEYEDSTQLNDPSMPVPKPDFFAPHTYQLEAWSISPICPTTADIKFNYGTNGDLPIAGDWNNDGIDTVGVFRPSTGTWYLKNSNSGGTDITFGFGANGNLPVAGDWNGDGIDTIGFFKPAEGKFYLKNSSSAGSANITFVFGTNGDKPISGDWNNDGIDTVGVFRPSNGMFYLRNSNSAGPVDITFAFGTNGDKPIAGDWNNDGVDTVGVFRPSNGMFYLKNLNSIGAADLSFNLGTYMFIPIPIARDWPIAGDWDSNGIDNVGMFANYTNSEFHLKDPDPIKPTKICINNALRFKNSSIAPTCPQGSSNITNWQVNTKTISYLEPFFQCVSNLLETKGISDVVFIPTEWQISGSTLIPFGTFGSEVWTADRLGRYARAGVLTANNFNIANWMLTDYNRVYSPYFIYALFARFLDSEPTNLLNASTSNESEITIYAFQKNARSPLNLVITNLKTDGESIVKLTLPPEFENLTKKITVSCSGVDCLYKRDVTEINGQEITATDGSTVLNFLNSVAPTNQDISSSFVMPAHSVWFLTANSYSNANINICGDLICDGDESCSNCVQDCGSCSGGGSGGGSGGSGGSGGGGGSYSGNGSTGNNLSITNQSVKVGFCGDSQCDGADGETSDNCPDDCKELIKCNNNGKCEMINGEDYINCPSDCSDQNILTIFGLKIKKIHLIIGSTVILALIISIAISIVLIRRYKNSKEGNDDQQQSYYLNNNQGPGGKIN